MKHPNDQRAVFDSLVIGGGLSGLTTALAMSKTGISVVLIDREPLDAALRADWDGRTTAIAASGKAMLDALGLWVELADEAEPILDIRVSDGESRRFLHYDHRQVGDAPMGYIVENNALKEALFRAVASDGRITHLSSVALEDFAAGPGRVTAKLSDGGEVRARLLIAADGRGSRVRDLAGIRAARIDYGQTSMICTVAHEHPHRGVAHERFLAGGPLAFLPMSGNHSSIVWTERTETARCLMRLDDRDFADALGTRFDDCLGELTVVGRREAFPLSLVNAETQTAHRLALVGDAAHGIHPIAGQGFNLGLRDIAALAEEVADAGRLGLDIGGAEVLRRFQARRRFDTMTVVLACDGLNRLFSNDNSALRALRSTGLGVVNGIPSLKRLFMRHAMGTLGELPSLLQGKLP